MPAPYPFTERFVAPDAGPDKEAYTCSFHWFRAADGRILGVDAIRSDDTGTLALRLFIAAEDGPVRALLHSAPASAWAPFQTASKAGIASRAAGKDVLGRGEAWVAGAVAAASDPRGISSASFELDLTVEAPALGPGQLGRPLLPMSVIDFPRIHYRGFVQIDGERLAIDAEGSVSLHFGARLVRYVYLATVADAARPGAPALLLAAARKDDFPLAGELLGERYAIYAFGRDGAPPVMIHVGRIDGPSIPVGWGASVELTEARPVVHALLEVPTITASARATLVRPAPTLTDLAHTERLDLGRVMVDCRGDVTAKLFPG